MMVIFKLRKYDLKLYALFTVVSTLAGVSSVYFIKDAYGSYEFADFALSTVYVQIVVALSDLGMRYSFFKPKSFFSERSNFMYLIALKVVIALTLFLISLIFYHTSIYLAHLPMVLGFVLFPTLLFQRYKLFTIIALNNFLFRVLPMIGLLFFSQIEGFVVFSGLILFSNSLLANMLSGVFSEGRFKYNYFKRIGLNVLNDNRFLSALSVINILEVYVHVFLAKVFLTKDIFSEFMYIERYTNYVKQVVVYLYDFFYPKIVIDNINSYQKYVRKAAFLIAFGVATFLFLEAYGGWIFQGFNSYVLIIAMAIVPAFILLFNFVQSTVYFKYCSDKRGVIIVLTAVVLKLLIFFVTQPFIGVLAIPLGLVSAEIYMGIRRAIAVHAELDVKVQFF
jgi:hypothetical protein